ncbi:MAG TPA: hypothetical protein VFM93_06220 [Candidatus Limnocylindria bacterium]|nr:hypothetical protein [Candidatus Limnocylindria bacterium]
MPRRATGLDELVAYLVPEGTALAGVLRPWLAASPRFRAFAEAHRDKIRKKARALADDDGRSDLAFELDAARRILGDRRFSVEYEPYGIARRAPDFRVTFREGVRFNVEARRLRRPGRDAGAAAPLARAICDKLGQLPPSIANVLIVGGPGTPPEALPLAVAWLDERAARRDDAAFVARGLAGARDYARRAQRLSAAIAVSEGGAPQVWRNPRARHPLPEDLARALVATLT